MPGSSISRDAFKIVNAIHFRPIVYLLSMFLKALKLIVFANNLLQSLHLHYSKYYSTSILKYTSIFSFCTSHKFELQYLIVLFSFTKGEPTKVSLNNMFFNCVESYVPSLKSHSGCLLFKR